MSSSDFKVDFVGIGCPKCGTTWVAHILDSHPEIDFSRSKETNHFTSDSYRQSLPKRLKQMNYITGDRSYRQLFKDDGRVKGEFSILYFYDEEALKSIKAHNPNVKLLLCLRHPVDASISSYRYDLSSAQGNTPYNNVAEAVTNNPTFAHRYKYAKHLRRLFKIFDTEQVLILLNDDIRSDPKKVAKKLYSFIGVDDSFFPEGARGTIHETRQLRFGVMQPIANVFVKAMIALNAQKILELLYPLWHRLGKKSGSKIAVTDQERTTMQDFYQRDIDQTSKILGRSLEDWKNAQ